MTHEATRGARHRGERHRALGEGKGQGTRHDAHEVQGKAYGTGAGGVGVWHTAWAYGMSRDIRRGT